VLVGVVIDLERGLDRRPVCVDHPEGEAGNRLLEVGRRKELVVGDRGLVYVEDDAELRSPACPLKRGPAHTRPARPRAAPGRRATDQARAADHVAQRPLADRLEIALVGARVVVVVKVGGVVAGPDRPVRPDQWQPDAGGPRADDRRPVADRGLADVLAAERRGDGDGDERRAQRTSAEEQQRP
jgi:hypothetical protein